jgi:uncharacterized DUF497 family protein
MITWDDNKRRRNLRVHGIDLADLECVFDSFMLTVEDTALAYGETRLQSLCWFRGSVVFMVWTERADGARIISCRKGSGHEKRTYIQALPH